LPNGNLAGQNFRGKGLFVFGLWAIRVWRMWGTARTTPSTSRNYEVYSYVFAEKSGDRGKSIALRH
jgi:hypothetical protein